MNKIHWTPNRNCSLVIYNSGTIGNFELLEEDRDLAAVGGRSGIQEKGLSARRHVVRCGVCEWAERR